MYFQFSFFFWTLSLRSMLDAFNAPARQLYNWTWSQVDFYVSDANLMLSLHLATVNFIFYHPCLHAPDEFHLINAFRRDKGLD
jgi:hypothetical protein